MRPNSIVLTGFMGTGKTTVGRLLAARTGRFLVDTDEVIAHRAGTSIAQIFAEQGEDRFRQMERALAEELAGQEGLVISTGGGLMLDATNAQRLDQGNLVICLMATPEEILERVEDDGVRRPLLEGTDPAQRVRQILKQRAAGYGQFPQVGTGNRSPEDVVREIVQTYEPQHGRRENRQPERVAVTFPGGQYEVTIGTGLLEQFGDVAGPGRGRLAVISDANVAPLYAENLDIPTTLFTIPAGEEYKRLDTVRTLYEQLLEAGVDRTSTIVALGGGVVGDVAGFVAATFMRGIRLVQCPTSLLAMVDASVGGKTGVDLPQGKNLVGAFKQPAAVLADVATLGTLPPAEFASGMAEVVKHGLIAGESLLRKLETGRWSVAESPHRLLPRLQSLVLDAIKVKRDVVQADPFEQGRRATLNLGHTFAHAIERVSNYTIRHGEAVAMGLVAACHLSSALGYSPVSLQERVEVLLKSLYLPTRIPAGLHPGALLEAMGSDKKKAAGRLRFILIRNVGEVFIADDVPRDHVLETLKALSAE